MDGLSLPLEIDVVLNCENPKRPGDYDPKASGWESFS